MCVLDIVCCRLPWIKDFFKPEEGATNESNSENCEDWCVEAELNTLMNLEPEHDTDSSTSPASKFWSDEEKVDSWSETSSTVEDAAESGDWDQDVAKVKPKAGW